MGQVGRRQPAGGLPIVHPMTRSSGPLASAMASLWIRFSGTGSLSRASRRTCSGVHLADLQSESPSRAGRHIPASPDYSEPGSAGVVETRAYRPMRNIFAGLRVWPKTDFTFGEARLAAISECPPTLAAVDPFRPGRYIILQAAPASGGSSRASTPRGWPPVPGRAAAVRSGSRTSWRHITGRCGSAS